MSVMNCSRNECSNIMCSRYSSRYGYICSECFLELVDLGPTVNIGDFMDTPKKTVYKEREAALARYNVEFPEDDLF